MISGKYNVIDRNTNIIVTHHGLYSYCLIMVLSNLSKNEKYYYLTNREYYNKPIIMYYLISKQYSVIYVKYH